MVRICTTVVGILAALATTSFGKPVDAQTSVADVQRDMASIRSGPLPELTAAIHNMGSSPDTLTDSQLQALNSGAEGLLNALKQLVSTTEDVSSVSPDEAEGVMRTFEETHPEIINPIDELKGKSSAFTENKAVYKEAICNKLNSMGNDYVKATGRCMKISPEGPWKTRGEALRRDAVQHFSALLKAFSCHFSRATAVDDVVRYADELREDVFPPVKTAVENLPGSSSELQVCHVVVGG
ncbi:hypothetical protein PQX77_005686 [Marasmius sp. AFHP31]|nr:hypothetical protein PQX77_005686 [Marasmius sp. AFHP31]